MCPPELVVRSILLHLCPMSQLFDPNPTWRAAIKSSRRRAASVFFLSGSTKRASVKPFATCLHSFLAQGEPTEHNGGCFSPRVPQKEVQLPPWVILPHSTWHSLIQACLWSSTRPILTSLAKAEQSRKAELNQPSKAMSCRKQLSE